MRIIVATGNENKVREMGQILEPLGMEIISMRDAGIDVDIVEDGETFEENALIKARAVAKFTRGIVLADDSGIEIDAFDGAPGVKSARFLGEKTPYDIKNKEILIRLSGLPDEERGARFVCAIAAVLPDGRELVVRRTFEGMIAKKEAGEGGFGYDPIFYLPERECTSAELSPEEKNEISHRGQALRAMREELEKVL